jgi:hypothetical protein
MNRQPLRRHTPPRRRSFYSSTSTAHNYHNNKGDNGNNNDANDAHVVLACSTRATRPPGCGWTVVMSDTCPVFRDDAAVYCSFAQCVVT